MQSNSNFSNLGEEFLKIAFEESSKRLEASLRSFRQIVDKSYVATAIYFSVIAYFFDKMEVDPVYWIVLIGAIISTIKIWSNLFPGIMYLPGTDPKDSIHSFYADKKEKVKEFYISKLSDHSNAIKINEEEVKKRNRKFKHSALIMVFAFVLSFSLSAWRIISCLTWPLVI